MWGREEPREGPCSATGFLRGSCPASLILEPISPEKEYNGCPWGIFLPSDSRAGLLRPSMSHPSMSWPCSCPLLRTTSPVLWGSGQWRAVTWGKRRGACPKRPHKRIQLEMFYAVFQVEEEKNQSLRTPWSVPTECSPQQAEHSMRVPRCQPQDSPPGRIDGSLLSRVSCGEGGECASCLPAWLSGSVAESACYGLRTVAVSNLLGEGLPAWACDSPSTQESWQCQNWGPMEPARPSCWGQQLTAGPRRDGQCSCTPPPHCSLVPVLTSMPLAPFSTMVVVG